MNKLFRPKCINRIIVFLALLAPIIYLFGTMGTYLMGAHGNLVLAQYETTIVADVEYEGHTYKRACGSLGVSSVSANGSDIADYGMDFYIGIDSFYVYSGADDEDMPSDSPYFDYVGLTYESVSYDYFCVDSDYDSNLDLPYLYFLGEVYFESTGFYCVSFGCYDSSNNGYIYFEGFISYDSITSDFNQYWYRYVSSGSDWFLDDEFASAVDTTIYVPVSETITLYTAGFMADNASLNAIRQIPASYVVVESDDYVENSDYLFGQMFPRDNFLAKVGQNALSDNPMGFAPFGSLLKFVDQNMLHMGSSQLALMGYGYFYWCAHVLLLDVLFAASVFFLRFIKSMFNRFEKGSD